jgi:hypothetical protein
MYPDQPRRDEQSSVFGKHQMATCAGVDVTASLRELTEPKTGENPQEILTGKRSKLGHHATA